MDNYPPHFKKLFSIIAMFMLVYTFVEIYLARNTWAIKNLVYFIPLIGFSLLYRQGFFYKSFRFDAQFFYPPKNKPAILISSIQSIKLTSLANKNIHYWEITYLSDKPMSVRVLPPIMEDSFARFIGAVKEANPTVDADIFEFNLYFGFLPFVHWKPKKN